jgi:hypothetical protein
MNLLIRVLRFFVILAFRLLLGLITVLARFLLLPIFLAVLRVLSRLVFTSFTSTLNGPRQYTDRLASEWTRRVLELGVSRDNIDRVFRLCRFLVASMIFLGWAVSALFTVAILRVVFGIFI